MQTLLLTEAAECLKRGEVVAFPTETVYGLGAPIFNKDAIEQIFQLKKRPRNNPLIAHISCLKQLDRIVREIPASFFLLCKAFFPGPLTIILPAHPDVPKEVTAGLSTLGVRMPNHPLALRLIDLVGEPLVAPSANLSGRPSATSIQHVLYDFGEHFPVFDGGICKEGIESTVLSLVETPVIYRPGSVTKEALEEVLGQTVILYSEKDVSTPPSPGLKYRHYAPKAPLFLFSTFDEMVEHVASNKEKKLLILSSKEEASSFEGMDHHILHRSTLFHLLRLADREQYDEVLVFCDYTLVQDKALMNRLKKAALIE